MPLPKSKLLPQEGVRIEASAGNQLTRVHLDLHPEGLTLSAVGAATATSLKEGNTHRVVLSPVENGVTLSIVGAASSAVKPV